MKKWSVSRITIFIIMVTVVFLQPNIHCSSNDTPGGRGKNARNPIYAPRENVGMQWAASAPDEILASEVKLKPGAVELPDGVMDHLEKADLQSGEYVFDSGADEVADLKPGSFVFFRNHSVRKIISTGKKKR